MTQKHKTDGPNDRGYGMIKACEIDSMREVLKDKPEEQAAVWFNIANYIAGRHGYGYGKDLPMSTEGHALYVMIKNRIAQNIEHGLNRPFGAPDGNQNARKLTAKDKKNIIEMHMEGYSLRQIAAEYRISHQSVKLIIDGINDADAGVKNNIGTLQSAGVKNNIGSLQSAGVKNNIGSLQSAGVKNNIDIYTDISSVNFTAEQGAMAVEDLPVNTLEGRDSQGVSNNDDCKDVSPADAKDKDTLSEDAVRLMKKVTNGWRM